MQVVRNILKFREKVPVGVCLVAVSKTQPIESISEAYGTGQRDFGENRAQEMADKYQQLPRDIQWHFIGHLQTNKVKFITSFVHLIHSVDSLKLLLEINKEGIKHQRLIDCLLQFYIAREESKFGLDLQEATELLTSRAVLDCRNVRICGVMGMASFTDNKEAVRTEFKELKNIYDHLKLKHFQDAAHFNICSMGMTQDFEIAIEEGSTLIRIGTAIFGERDHR